MNVIDGFLVGILCMTYNHSAYIADALDGFVIQRTDFPFVAIIMDDASTDGEQDVISRYLEEGFLLSDDLCKRWETEEALYVFARHKENVNCHFLVVYLKKNLYKTERKDELIKEWCNAKYIAHCEGDDYWTDPLKLQKQVDFLESHSDCIMSVHAANWEEDGKMAIKGVCYENECDLTVEEIICNGGLYLALASTLYRQDAIPTGSDRPLWWRMADVGDYPLHIFAALKGKVHFFPETMSVYRFQHPGSWTYNAMKSGLNVGHSKTEISWMTRLDEETDCKYSDAVFFHLIIYYSFLYRNRQVPFNNYYRAFKKAPNHTYKRLFHDVLIRNFGGLYRLYRKLNTYKNT